MIQHFKINIPKPGDVAGKILAADSVHNDHHITALLACRSHTDALVIGNAVLMLGGQQGSLAVAEGEGNDSAVFQYIIVHVRCDLAAVDTDDPCDRIGRQNIIDIIQGFQCKGDGILSVDFHRAGCQVNSGDRVGGIPAVITAGGAGIMTDMVVMMGSIPHWFFTDRTISAVVIDAFKRLRIGGELVRSKINNVFFILTETGNKRIVRVQDQPRLIANAVEQCVIDPLGMTVPRQLVAVKIGDHIMRRLDVAERIARKALVAFDQ